MRLRKLKIYDAPFMLEWMHNKSIIDKLRGNFLEKTLADCEKFIEKGNDSENLHLAIVNDEDVYMGTVSLKNIDKESLSAELAIVLRDKAIGKGYSKFALEEIIKIAWERIGINKIYWCVNRANKRAIRFYNKNGYPSVNTNVLRNVLVYNGYSSEEIDNYFCYQLERKQISP